MTNSTRYEPTEEQALTSPTCAALAVNGATEREVIEALFRENRRLLAHLHHLACFQPIGPIIHNGKVFTNPTADALAAAGHARAMTKMLEAEREAGRQESESAATRRAAEVFRETHDAAAKAIAEARAGMRGTIKQIKSELQKARQARAESDALAERLRADLSALRGRLEASERARGVAGGASFSITQLFAEERAKGAAEERETCAEIAEEGDASWHCETFKEQREDIAARIRARGATPPAPSPREMSEKACHKRTLGQGFQNGFEEGVMAERSRVGGAR